MKLSDLKPAPYNPRRISAKALAGLKRSLSAFGDLAGLVWNRRTGHLVAGHQRMDALRQEHGDGLRIEDDAVVTPTGERFPVRVVDWDEATEKAANVAANNPHIAGEFTDGLAVVLEDIKVTMPELAVDLCFDDFFLPIQNEPVPDPLGMPDRDPNIIIRLSVPPGVWIGKRGEILGLLAKFERLYEAKTKVSE